MRIYFGLQAFNFHISVGDIAVGIHSFVDLALRQNW